MELASYSGSSPAEKWGESLEEPYSVSGKAVSQEEEPFSLARFTDLRRLSDRRAVRSWASFEFFSLVCCLTVAVDSNCLAIMSIPVVLILGYDVHHRGRR